MESSVHVSSLVDLFVLDFFLFYQMNKNKNCDDHRNLLFRWQRHAGETAGVSR